MRDIDHIGDCQELEKICQNVQELDVSRNKFNDWNEVIINFYLKTILIT